MVCLKNLTLSSVSEDQSLLVMPPWRNPLLIAADLLSLGLHFMILYVPFLASLFQLQPLDLEEVSNCFRPFVERAHSHLVEMGRHSICPCPSPR